MFLQYKNANQTSRHRRTPSFDPNVSVDPEIIPEIFMPPKSPNTAHGHSRNASFDKDDQAGLTRIPGMLPVETDYTVGNTEVKKDPPQETGRTTRRPSFGK